MSPEDLNTRSNAAAVDRSGVVLRLRALTGHRRLICLTLFLRISVITCSTGSHRGRLFFKVRLWQ